ncbi:MAG: hypothetical protein LBU55_02090 [Elusimicrobiota bacterium]|jgi:predicted outer membrane repeat protein|nr:hypothetical protein [Elusimicrobiota bacterium]
MSLSKKWRLVYLVFFCFFLFFNCSYAIDVSNFQELQDNLIANDERYINVTANIFFDARNTDNAIVLGNMVKTVNGGDYSLTLSSSSNRSVVSASTGTSSLVFKNFVGVLNFIGNCSEVNEDGGSIYNAFGSTISFIDSSVIFRANVAKNRGGSIYNEGEINFAENIEQKIEFLDNVSIGDASYGRDIYNVGKINLGGMGSVVINGGIAGTNAAIISKTATGLFELKGDNQYYEGLFLQTSGTTTVTGNGSTYFGGYSSITNSKLRIINGGVINSGQLKADIGSEVEIDNGKILGGQIVVSGNATITARNSDINIEDKNYTAFKVLDDSHMLLDTLYSLKLSGNFVGDSNGGAIYSNALLDILNTAVAFTMNSANKGGAIYAGSGSRAEINVDGTGNFSSNSAFDGGAIYLDGGSYISIVGSGDGRSVTEFRDNKAKKNDYTYGDGGAIYAASGSSVTILADAGIIIFKGNTANKGGAIYADNGSTVCLSAYGGNVMFEGNKALNGNVEANADNDVYLSENARLNLEANSGRNILFYGGIAGKGDCLDVSGAGINKLGAGMSRIYGDLKFGGNLNIKEGIFEYFGNNMSIRNVDVATGSSFVVAGAKISNDSISNTGTNKYAANSVNNYGIFNMQNNEVDVFEVNSEFTNDGGDIKIEIFPEKNGNDGISDKINANKVSINGGKLMIRPAVGRYSTLDASTGIFYSLLVSNSNIADFENFGFDSIEFDIEYLKVDIYDYSLYLNDEKTILKLSVDAFVQSNFKEYAISYNQQQAAAALDDISTYYAPIERLIKETISEAKKQNSVAILRKLPEQLSGYFLANLVRSAVSDNLEKEIYNKVRLNKHNDNKRNAIWVQTVSGQSGFKRDDNSPHPYRDTSYGATFGFNNWTSENANMGIFGKYQKNDIYQSLHNAHIDNIGGGLYGGFLLCDIVEIKAMLSGIHSNIQAERFVDYESQFIEGNKASSGFSSLSLSSDIEISLKRIGVTDMLFRPYVGMQMHHMNYGKILESGAYPLVLEAVDGSYSREVLRIGAELRYGDENKNNKFVWYGAVELKYILVGTLPSIDVKAVGSNAEYKSVGFEENKIVPGLGFGIEFDVYRSLRLNAALNYYGGQGYESYKANIGIKYDFGNFRRRHGTETVA